MPAKFQTVDCLRYIYYLGQIENHSFMDYDIPSMEDKKVKSYLYNIAKELENSGAVVECGSWLGGSIAPVAQALSEIDSQMEIHCYDRWEADEIEVSKAAKQGVSIDEEQDTLPLFKQYVDGIYPHIVPHKTSLLEAAWTGERIKLFIDDASKDPKLFNSVLNTFGPYFVPGETIIVLMDYQVHERTTSNVNKRLRKCQKYFIEANKDSFEQIADLDNSSGVAFRYTNPIDWNKPILQTPFQRMYATSAVMRWLAWKIISFENS